MFRAMNYEALPLAHACTHGSGRSEATARPTYPQELMMQPSADAVAQTASRCVAVHRTETRQQQLQQGQASEGALRSFFTPLAVRASSHSTGTTLL